MKLKDGDFDIVNSRQLLQDIFEFCEVAFKHKCLVFKRDGCVNAQFKDVTPKCLFFIEFEYRISTLAAFKSGRIYCVAIRPHEYMIEKIKGIQSDVDDYIINENYFHPIISYQYRNILFTCEKLIVD